MMLPAHKAAAKGRMDALVGPAIVLRASYAMPGTDLAYGDIGLRVCYAMSGTDLVFGDIALRLCYGMSDTDIAYDTPARVIIETFPSLMFEENQVAFPTSLRACYAMPGTEMAYGCISLRACYAMS
eukprot:3191622-Rhodomonas_salina.4